jgi:hypothetical protein
VTVILVVLHFGGFSPDGARFLKLGSPEDRVCAVVSGAEAPACQPIAKKEIREIGFVKPARGGSFHVALKDDRIEVTDGDRVVASWKPAERLVAVNSNLFVAPGGGAVAVEYELGGGGKDVVALAVAPAPASAPAAPVAPASAPSGGKNAYDRAMARGGIWEQRMLACDQAGVQLKLKKNRKFGLTITTRCQGDKSTTELDGLWTTEGADGLTLSFENADAATETLPCHFAACVDAPGEDCLVCRDEDIAFTLQVVRR